MTPWLQELAEAYGTPAYVYDLGAVARAHAALVAALPLDARIYYSLKANPHPALVGALQRLGCAAEISSTGELSAALGAGVPPVQILYTGPAKSRAEIVAALAAGVTHFSAESPRDLERIAAEAARREVTAELLLRVNPDRGLSSELGLAMSGASTQFGADAAWVLREPAAFASRPHARVVGVHCYMGTNFGSAAALLESFTVGLETSLEVAARVGFQLELLDLGGGFGHPFAAPGPTPDFTALRAPLTALLDRRLPGWRQRRPQLAFESGRYLVAASGTLLTRVEDVKLGKGRRFVVVDTGIHHLGGMAGLRRVPNIGARPLAGEGASDPVAAEIVGPLCTPLDQLARGVQLPLPSVGELLAIPNTGAYGLTASLLAFLSRELPVEIVVEEERVVSAARLAIVRESVANNKARAR